MPKSQNVMLGTVGSHVNEKHAMGIHHLI